ncbi:hypothetical protein [Ascidiimonas aurantiaca]|uniref:hypothetical protein n=1 Tax=Ascidiimonas aurantiaca TaxID=1685432 RepID=UPI0030EEA71B
MMNDIIPIYHNKYGISFRWKRTIGYKDPDKVQLVFREMGFYFSVNQLKDFLYFTQQSRKHTDYCNCDVKEQARCILLKTPSSHIELAVNSVELDQIEDLLQGTLFHLSLNNLLVEKGLF